MAKSEKKKIPFQTILSALLDETTPFPPSFLHRFSDLNMRELGELETTWLKVNPARRLALMEDLEELAESDTLVSFDGLAVFALDDPDPMVRAAAIRLLWENQDLALVDKFSSMLDGDPEAVVRAAAASALGLFVYLGELEEIPADILRSVEDQLLAAARGTDEAIVRRRAVESLGYSSREEVPGLIESAYTNVEPEWLSSALFAMGRSADPRWESQVLNSLNHPDPIVQMEAVRAAGQLEIASARVPLLNFLEDKDEDTDEDIFAAAIWSLSQIGGEEVREKLEKMAEETEDEEELELIEIALENLTFTEDFGIFGMFDFDEDEDVEETEGSDGFEDDEDEEPGNGNGHVV